MAVRTPAVVMVDRAGGGQGSKVEEEGGGRPGTAFPGRGSGKALIHLLGCSHARRPSKRAHTCLPVTSCLTSAHGVRRWPSLDAPGGGMASLPAGPLASPSSGSWPLPPGRRGWSEAAAGPPAAADTSLGRTYTRSAASALGPSRRHGRHVSRLLPYCMKGSPLPDLLPLPPSRPLVQDPQLPGLMLGLHGVPTQPLSWKPLPQLPHPVRLPSLLTNLRQGGIGCLWGAAETGAAVAVWALPWFPQPRLPGVLKMKSARVRGQLAARAVEALSALSLAPLRAVFQMVGGPVEPSFGQAVGVGRPRARGSQEARGTGRGLG